MSVSENQIRANIARTAAAEVGNDWSNSAARILDYFKASYPQHNFTKDEALQYSWCSFFVMWVLIQAGAINIPKQGSTASVPSIRRFFDVYPSWVENGNPKQLQAGDLYHIPSGNYHIGVITAVDAETYFSTTADGNGYRRTSYAKDEYMLDKDHKNILNDKGKPKVWIGAGGVSQGGPGLLHVKHAGVKYLRYINPQ